MARKVSWTTSLLIDVDSTGPFHSIRPGTTMPVVLPDCEGPTTITEARCSQAIRSAAVDAEREATQLGTANAEHGEIAT